MLITKELENIIPKLYATEGIKKLEDKIVYVKIFTPDSNWTKRNRALWLKLKGTKKSF